MTIQARMTAAFLEIGANFNAVYNALALKADKTRACVNKTASFALTSADTGKTFLIDSSAALVTATLPAAATCAAWQTKFAFLLVDAYNGTFIRSHYDDSNIVLPRGNGDAAWTDVYISSAYRYSLIELEWTGTEWLGTSSSGLWGDF